VLGKHSGSAAVRAPYGALRIRVDADEAAALLAQVRAYAVRHKHPPQRAELLRLYHELIHEAA
jgi:homocitrate synthase NifV